MNNKLDFIFRRRSIRKFKDQSISNSIIIDLLEAATAAPTAANSEPWEFIVINDHKLLNSIREQFVFAKYNSPLAIVVCGNLKLAFKGPGKDMWIQDCSTVSILIPMIMKGNIELKINPKGGIINEKGNCNHNYDSGHFCCIFL